MSCCMTSTSVFVNPAQGLEICHSLRLVFTSDGVVVGVIIRRVEQYGLVKIKLMELEAEH